MFCINKDPGDVSKLPFDKNLNSSILRSECHSYIWMESLYKYILEKLQTIVSNVYAVQFDLTNWPGLSLIAIL